MNDFSIELSAEQIVDRRTRENFQEVLSCFIAGNMRSAMVMLWTVVVCDLVYKLQDLRDAEGDPVARSLLEEVSRLQLKDAKSSGWESSLLDGTWKRTSLLDSAEYTQLGQIQELRHLSAHPVLGSADILYRPNRETTRACIRNALEALLLKPALFSKGVVDALVLDLAAKRDLLLGEDALRRYLEARFLAPGTPPAIEDAMFQRLWALAFRAADPLADANRDINTRTMAVLYRRRPAAIRAHVAAHAGKYSAVGDGDRLRALVWFLGRHQLLFEPLTDAAKVPVTKAAEADLDLFVLAWYLSPNAESHIASISERLREGHARAVADRKRSPDLLENAWRDFVEAARNAGAAQEAFRIGAAQYTRSRSFDEANDRFDRYVAPFFREYDAATLRGLLDGIEDNSQTWGRGRARLDHAPILASAKRSLGRDFDPKQYRNFIREVAECLNGDQ